MNPNGRTSSRRRSLVVPGAALLAAATLGLGGSPDAQAGTYQITQCADPATGVPTGLMTDWSAPAVKAVNYCATGGHFGIEIEATNAMGAGTIVHHRLTIPDGLPGVTLTKAELWYRSLRVSAGSEAFVLVDGGNARIWEEVAGTDHTAMPANFTPSVGARSIQLALYCGTSASTGCWFPSRDVLSYKKVRLTLAESVPPSGSLDGGSMLASGARQGAQTVSYSAEDAESGVAVAQIRLGDTVVGTHEFTKSAVDCPRDAWAACRRARPGEEIAIDTSKVSDGVHALSLRVEDAAGNARVVPGPEVTVDNVREEVREVPITAPSTGTPGAGAATGGAGTANGTNASPDARLVSYVGHSRASSARTVYGRRMTIRGRLVDPSGRAIGGATLAVLTKVGGGALREVDQVRTDADGRYFYAVPAGPSRVIRFAYKASRDDQTFASTSDVTLRVAAKARLRVTPGRVRNGRAVTFRGVVLGGHLPSRGVHVDLQVKQRGWRTFGVARATRAGRFSFRYRFTRTFQPTAYTFRAKVRGEAGVPYEAGLSNRAKVVVR